MTVASLYAMLHQMGDRLREDPKASIIVPIFFFSEGVKAKLDCTSVMDCSMKWEFSCA